MTAEMIMAVAGPALTALSVVAGSLIGRKQGLRAGEAATKQAANEARRAVTADWTSYTKLLMARLGAVESRAEAAERRLDAAEGRAEVAEERAIGWESRYRMAVLYVKALITWAADVTHMNAMPVAPPELQGDL